jgi:hypothetical protein
MKWEEGRQKTGYMKKCLINSKRFKFDVYLLKYPEGSEIPEHIDSAIIPFHEHHRLNIELKRAEFGGSFRMNGYVKPRRVHYFRPDLVPHSVDKIRKGTRYVLSIGWNKVKKTISG